MTQSANTLVRSQTVPGGLGRQRRLCTHGLHCQALLKCGSSRYCCHCCFYILQPWEESRLKLGEVLAEGHYQWPGLSLLRMKWALTIRKPGAGVMGSQDCHWIWEILFSLNHKKSPGLWITTCLDWERESQMHHSFPFLLSKAADDLSILSLFPTNTKPQSPGRGTRSVADKGVVIQGLLCPLC